MSDPIFESTGQSVIDDFLDPEDCRELLRQIRDYREQTDVPEIYRPVRGRSLRYSVIDGEEIRANLPSIWDLYLGLAKNLVNELNGVGLEPLANTKMGANVNIMSPGRTDQHC